MVQRPTDAQISKFSENSGVIQFYSVDKHVMEGAINVTMEKEAIMRQEQILTIVRKDAGPLLHSDDRVAYRTNKNLGHARILYMTKRDLSLKNCENIYSRRTKCKVHLPETGTRGIIIIYDLESTIVH